MATGVTTRIAIATQTASQKPAHNSRSSTTTPKTSNTVTIEANTRRVGLVDRRQRASKSNPSRKLSNSHRSNSSSHRLTARTIIMITSTITTKKTTTRTTTHRMTTTTSSGKIQLTVRPREPGRTGTTTIQEGANRAETTNTTTTCLRSTSHLTTRSQTTKKSSSRNPSMSRNKDADSISSPIMRTINNGTVGVAKTHTVAAIKIQARRRRHSLKSSQTFKKIRLTSSIKSG